MKRSAKPPTGQLALDLDDQRQIDIAQIHRATGVYTVRPEVERLLDEVGWPARAQTLLDPGCGDGAFLVSALSRLHLDRDEIDQAADRVRGYEFHPGALADARQAVRAHLAGRGWSPGAAGRAAAAIAEERDFLLSHASPGQWGALAGNPPYLRQARLPAGYRADFDRAVASHANGDLLHAYLDKSAGAVKRGGEIAFITADRWLLNASAASLRERIGALFRVAAAARLDAESAFYRPKQRRPGTLARVHPVRLLLTPGGPGRSLGREPFRLSPVPQVDGVPLPSVASLRLAPWLGPLGCFYISDPAGLPSQCLVPVAEPEDISGETLRPATRWAIVTGRERPPAAVLDHIDANLHLIPPGKRREPRWLPPETFAGRLPLDRDTVLVPRIAKRLRGVRLPAGRLPVGHQLVVISGLPVDTVIAVLDDPLVQAQADALALGVDGGYFSYTATLARELVIPRRHLAREPA